MRYRLLAAVLIAAALFGCDQPTAPLPTEEFSTPTIVTPTATPFLTATPTRDPIVAFTPTQETLEDCFAITIEYIVVTDVLRVRAGPGTSFSVIDPGLTRGQRILSDNCFTVANGFHWVKIKQGLRAGQWVARNVVNGTSYLE